MARTKFVVYLDAKKEYRWKLLAANGESVAVGGEGLKDRKTAMNAVKKLAAWAATDKIVDETVAAPVAAKPVAKKAAAKAAPKKAAKKAAAPKKAAAKKA